MDGNVVLLELLERVRRIENLLMGQKATKEKYTTAEFAQLVGLKEYTVREHCRLGRLRAQKRECGRGISLEWSLSHSELVRYQNDGLLPDPHLTR